MPGDPHSWSKVWKAPNREIGKPGQNRGKIIAHRDFHPCDRPAGSRAFAKCYAVRQCVLLASRESTILMCTLRSAFNEQTYCADYETTVLDEIKDLASCEGKDVEAALDLRKKESFSTLRKTEHSKLESCQK